MTTADLPINVAHLPQLLSFFEEIDKLKSVERRNRLADGSRRENTAEHSWHLGMAVALMAPLLDEPVDVGRAMLMALVHDIVEIDAGDTFAFDTVGAQDKEEREQLAADRLFGLLPDAMGDHLRSLWDEYERGDTVEARLVMAVDRTAPMILNMAEGASTWREHNLTAARVADRNGPHIEPLIPELWAVLQGRLDDTVAKGNIAAG
jgi:putative hydrolases of HD superfamily